MSVNLSARQFAQPDLVAQVGGDPARPACGPASSSSRSPRACSWTSREAGDRRAPRPARARRAGSRSTTSARATRRCRTSSTCRSTRSRSTARSWPGSTGDDANLPIVQAVIALAHGLGIDVAAEGIETDEQLACLRELACDRGQGFLYARPLPAAELVRAAQLRARRRRAALSRTRHVSVDPGHRGASAGRARRLARPAAGPPVRRAAGRPRATGRRRDRGGRRRRRRGRARSPMNRSSISSRWPRPIASGCIVIVRTPPGSLVPGIAELFGPDLLDLGRRAHRPDAVARRVRTAASRRAPSGSAPPRAGPGRPEREPARRVVDVARTDAIEPDVVGHQRRVVDEARARRRARGSAARATSTAPGSHAARRRPPRRSPRSCGSMTSRSTASGSVARSSCAQP